MKRRPLGRSGIEVAPLAFGGNVFGWTVDEPSAFRLLDTFIGNGFNLVDTADVYSKWAPGNSGGESETVIGHWIALGGGRREKLVLATKVGMEMPGDMGVHSLQLWLNLPASHKMSSAAYSDQRLANTPVKKGVGYEVRVYAGRHGDVQHPHGSLWPLTLLDLRIQGEKRVEIEVPAGYRSFLYVLSGHGRIEGDDTAVSDEDVVWFKPAQADAKEGTVLGLEADINMHALFFAAPVIDEPVAAHGPFVMNTMEEVRRAYADYQSGRFVESPRRSA